MRNILVVLAMFICTSICLGDTGQTIIIDGDIVNHEKVREVRAAAAGVAAGVAGVAAGAEEAGAGAGAGCAGDAAAGEAAEGAVYEEAG